MLESVTETAAEIDLGVEVAPAGVVAVALAKNPWKAFS